MEYSAVNAQSDAHRHSHGDITSMITSLLESGLNSSTISHKKRTRSRDLVLQLIDHYHLTISTMLAAAKLIDGLDTDPEVSWLEVCAYSGVSAALCATVWIAAKAC